ncbi:HNH endonuclease [Herminiimonas sp. CN]|uniref:HNH endonuclease n=1 Tax=Herminiimonas sp. CN TaxID=1349818 RepID=UPI000473A247
MDWFRMYSEFSTDPKIKAMSSFAQKLSLMAHEEAGKRKTCYPNWRRVESLSGFAPDLFMACFDELCGAGIVADGFPSVLVVLADRYPLPPMSGPIGSSRPSASIWARLRTFVFNRDNFTCAYCGHRGGRLECDHVIPVSKGGHHGEDNLVTACFSCNRSKRAKSVSEWRDGK